jgi:hypothetical protein
MCDSTALKELPFGDLTDYSMGTEIDDSKKRILSLLEGHELKDFLHDNNLAALLNPHNTLTCSYYDEDSFNNKFKNTRNSLNVFSLNIRSLTKHAGELVNFLNLLNTKFQIIILTEIGARNLSVVYHLLRNHTFYYVPPDLNMYGGVGIYVSDCIENVSVVDKLKLKPTCDCKKCAFESLFLNFTFRHKLFTIGGIYRHPGGSVSHFLSALETATSNVDKCRTCILTGDFNINLINYDQECVLKYFTMLLSHKYFPYIVLPSRITENTATCIDHIFIRKSKNETHTLINSGLFYCDISDHLPCFVSLDLHVPVNTERPNVRLFSDINCSRFIENMSSVHWDELFTPSNDWYSVFVAKVKHIFQKSFPLVKLSRKRARDKPWITRAIKVSIKHNHRLYRNAIRKNNVNSRLIYKRYNVRLKKCIDHAQIRYYNDLFTNSKNATINIWKNLNGILNPDKKRKHTHINKILTNGQMVTDKAKIPNVFNNFFCNIGKQLQNQLPNVNASDKFKKYLPPPVLNSFYLEPVSIDDILTEIKKLNPRKACGPDSISGKLIQLCPQIFAIILCKIFNKSIEEGEYPTEMKIAKVIALHKKGELYLTDNYRPISLLSCFNKIFEKIVTKQLRFYFESKKLLYEFQFGFRKLFSTSLALIETTDIIKRSVDEGIYELGIFIDLTKAFDTVDHEQLLFKLENYGIRGHANNFFRSYLCQRKQFTVINTIQSDICEIQCGVPQGSVLGPLLFLIYINDMHRALNHARVRLFADDTCIFVQNQNFNELISDAKARLTEVSTWCVDNKLIVNSKKTHFVIFCSNRKNSYSHLQKIVIPNLEIHRSKEIKYLGMTIDENLSWKPHIENLCKSLIKYFGIFNHVKKLLPRNVARQIYFAFIYSRISYGIEVLSNCSFKLLSKVQIIQNKLLKILLQLEPRTSTNMLHHRLKILKIKDIQKVKIICFVNQCLLGLYPPYFQNYFRYRDRVYNLRNEMLSINRTKTVLGSFNTQVYGAKLWNELVESVKKFRYQKNFKKHLVKDIINGYGQI